MNAWYLMSMLQSMASIVAGALSVRLQMLTDTAVHSNNQGEHCHNHTASANDRLVHRKALPR